MQGPMQGRPAPETRGRHAVVVGGGIGGLLAGLVLRRRFERVTVLERDGYPATPGPRRGAPQGRCLHMLAAEGLRVIEGLVPGWTAALVRAGAVPFDVGLQARVRLGRGWLPREAAGITMLACSRALLEHELRVRAQREPGVVLAPGHAVKGLLGDATWVSGTRVDAGGRAWDEPAELTVVATGGRSALASWWSVLGLAPVERTVVPARCGYVSRWFEIPPGFDAGWKLLSITPAPGVAWGGVIFEAEGGRWGVVLLVPREQAVPSTDAEFLEACTRLAAPEISEVLRVARPASPIVRHERTDNCRMRFERAPRWPEGLAVVGDAACMLDPYFGLGMTACARGVAALAEPDWAEPGQAHAFQRRLAALQDEPWQLTTGAEPLEPAAAYYRRTLLELAPRSPAIARLLLRRMHLLDPPDALDRPEAVALVHEALTGPRREPPARRRGDGPLTRAR